MASMRLGYVSKFLLFLRYLTLTTLEHTHLWHTDKHVQQDEERRRQLRERARQLIAEARSGVKMSELPSYSEMAAEKLKERSKASGELGGKCASAYNLSKTGNRWVSKSGGLVHNDRAASQKSQNQEKGDNLEREDNQKFLLG
uniref:Uncharacterized protein n=1 Tax=Sphaerodactylus townsendi TaxID=933632 RepID=A0ACB8GEX7_9SAUR